MTGILIDMWGLFILLLLVVVAWFYFSRMREAVTAKSRILCRQNSLQLLDQTVSLGKIHTPRSLIDVTNPLFEYHFEISQKGTDRYQASAFVRNHRVLQVVIFHPDGNIILQDALSNGDHRIPVHKTDNLTGEI